NVSGPPTTAVNSARQKGRKRRNAASISFIGSGLQGERGEIGRCRKVWRARDAPRAHARHRLRDPKSPVLKNPKRHPRAEKKPTCDAWALRGIAQLYGSGALEASHPSLTWVRARQKS